MRPEEEPKLFAMDNLMRNAFGKKGSFEDSRISTALLRSKRRQQSVIKKNNTTIQVEKEGNERMISRPDDSPSLGEDFKKKH